jgi:hypothetical protein
MKFAPTNLPALIDWATEATTVFCNGVISGVGGSTLTGGGVGAISAQTENGVTNRTLALALAAAIFSALGNGSKRVQIWHANNPIPNPFGKFSATKSPLNST